MHGAQVRVRVRVRPLSSAWCPGSLGASQVDLDRPAHDQRQRQGQHQGSPVPGVKSHMGSDTGSEWDLNGICHGIWHEI